MSIATIHHRSGEYSVDSMSPSEVWQSLPEHSVAIVDGNVFELWEGLISKDIPTYVVPPGEASKGISVYGAIAEFLAAVPLSRTGTVLACGGGVVGDLAGFVAATYMRGVNWIQIPTTLLAMVDSSIGGKVGIDLQLGKNLLGSFWPPIQVRLATEFLTTLPERELRAGMAEVWKYSFIGNPDLFQLLGKNRDRSPSDLVEIVEMCIQDKAKIVEQDEFERTGARATLNFGHTVGHALETFLGYEDILHGEAISIGMVVETRLAEKLGVCKVGVADEIAKCLQEEGLPIHHSSLKNVDQLLTIMKSDKKASAGRLAFSLVSEIGKCKLVPDVSEPIVRDVLASNE